MATDQGSVTGRTPSEGWSAYPNLRLEKHLVFGVVLVANCDYEKGS